MKTKHIIITGAIVITILLLVMLFLLRSNGSLSRKAGPVRNILFVGDSNTVAGFSYADKLKKMIPGLSVKKVAQNGANSSWMKGELEKDLKNNRYDVISILSGSNDIYGGVNLNVTKNNLDEMYRLAKSKGSRVMAVSPPNKDFYTNKTDQKQALLSDLVSWIKNNPNVDYFIDFYQMTNNKNLFSSADGYLHPQSGAHDMLANKAIQELNLI